MLEASISAVVLKILGSYSCCRYIQSRADYSLFTRIQGKSFTALFIYVDDILITENDPVSIVAIKKFLHSQFHLKDLGDLKYFLGIEVSSSKNGIFIS